MDLETSIDIVLAVGLAIAGGAVCMGMALALHAKTVFPEAELFSFDAGKRARLLLVWGKIALVSVGTVLACVVVEDWILAAAAAVGVFLSMWALFRIRLVDVVWAYLTYAVFHLLWLGAFYRQLRLDY